MNLWIKVSQQFMLTQRSGAWRYLLIDRLLYFSIPLKKIQKRKRNKNKQLGNCFSLGSDIEFRNRVKIYGGYSLEKTLISVFVRIEFVSLSRKFK